MDSNGRVEVEPRVFSSSLHLNLFDTVQLTLSTRVRSSNGKREGEGGGMKGRRKGRKNEERKKRREEDKERKEG